MCVCVYLCMVALLSVNCRMSYLDMEAPCRLRGIMCLWFDFWFWCYIYCFVPSVLWCCWLGSRKGIWPVKNWVVRCWRGYLSGSRCRLAYTQLMPLPLTVSCFSKIQIGFTFLVPAHPGSTGKRAVKRVCVCVCALYILFACLYCMLPFFFTFSLVIFSFENKPVPFQGQMS